MYSLVLWIRADPKTSSILKENDIKRKNKKTFGRWGSEWHEVEIVISSGIYNALLLNAIIVLNLFCEFIQNHCFIIL